jgi:hypothetical protein
MNKRINPFNMNSIAASPQFARQDLLPSAIRQTGSGSHWRMKTSLNVTRQLSKNGDRSKSRPGGKTPMSYRYLVLLLLLGGILSAPSYAGDNTTMILSEGGPYHGADISAVSGADWFALYQTKNGFELRKVSIEVTTVKDEVLDSDNEQTGTKVTVKPESQQQNILLIKPQKSLTLTEGKVEGTLFDPGTTVYPDKSKRVKLNEKIYALVASGKKSAQPVERAIDDYALRLTLQKKSQRLFSQKGFLGYDGPPKVIWAGDLDRDGKLDLILDLSTHYNSSALTLFLSSSAKGNLLVEPVAEFFRMGC